MVEEPDSENSLFSEPMKMRTPSALLGAAEQVDHVAPRLQVVEQQPHPLEVLQRLEVVEQVRLAAHDQPALVALAARPARQPVVDDLLRQLVELGLRLLHAPLKLDLGFGQRLAADARVEKVGRLGQRRGRQADRQIDDAVLDLAVVADHHDQRALRLEPHELDVLQPHVRLCGEHHAGRAGQTREQPRGLGQHILDRLAGAGDLRLDRLRSLSLRSPICISASTKKRRPSSVGSRPAEVCGA